MRRRLVTVYVTLLVAACLALAVPLCGNIAARGTSDMLLDRMNDTARFAGLAEPSVLTGNGAPSPVSWPPTSRCTGSRRWWWTVTARWWPPPGPA